MFVAEDGLSATTSMLARSAPPKIIRFILKDILVVQTVPDVHCSKNEIGDDDAD
jgi:hypothetical protein